MRERERERERGGHAAKAGLLEFAMSGSPNISKKLIASRLRTVCEKAQAAQLVPI